MDLLSQRSSSTAADVMLGDGQFNTPAAENEILHLEGAHRPDLLPSDC